MTESPTTACPRCGALTPAGNRFCGSCGASVTPDPAQPLVASAVARGDRLSDSGALQLRQLLVEATQGDYEILDELGRGGMAVVYKATEVHLARTVAIKILPPDLTYARGATERFQREARTAAALDHPNIIPIHRISAGGRLFWYAMKYLEGRSLADVLAEKGLLTVNETVTILEQVADALDYAHQHGVVHRDIKPANVMLDVNGRVTVTDFGIAKEQTGGALTGSGAILGTPYYMSPEQCRGGANLTGAADQYSLGVMAYQMLSGQLPFEADSAIDVIHKHVTEPPPPLEALLPGLPRNVINGISRAMAKKAEDRFPTVRSFVHALKGSPAEVTLKMERRPSLVATRRSGGGRKPALRNSIALAIVGLVVISGIVGGVLWTHDQAVRAAADAQRAPSGTPAAPETQPAAQQSAPAAAQPPVPSKRPGATRRGSGAPARERGGAATGAPPAAAPARQGYVRINIANGYATIAIAGRTIADRRVWADSLPAGSYPVSFTREGWESETRTVTVRSGQETALSVTMRPRATP